MLNKSNKRLRRYYTFIFSLSCRIASVTSYFSENEAETYKMETFILPKFLTLIGIPREPSGVLRSVMAVFCLFFKKIFHALSIELINFLFDRSFPLKTSLQKSENTNTDGIRVFYPKFSSRSVVEDDHVLQSDSCWVSFLHYYYYYYYCLLLLLLSLL